MLHPCYAEQHEQRVYFKITLASYVMLLIVNGHRKQQLSYTENQQTLFLFPIFIDARLTYDQKIRMSSQSTTSYAILKCLSSGGPLPPVRNRATPSP